MKKIILLLIWFFSAQAWAQESFKRLDKLRFDNEETILRNTSFFAGVDNIEGNIPKGSEAKIKGFDLTKRYGVGIEIEITTGPQKGRKGWVYYPIDPSKREVTLMDRTGLPFVREGDFFDFFKKAADYKDSIKEATHVDLVESTPMAIEYDPAKRDYIWRQISKGKYQIDLEKYDGGPFVPVIAEEVDDSGHTVKKTLYVRRDFNRLLGVAGNISDEQLRQNDEYCPPMEIADQQPVIEVKEEESSIPSIRPRPRPPELVPTFVEVPKPPEGNWHPGCEILAKSDLTEADEEKMGKCLQTLKKVVTENNLDSNRRYIRSGVFRDMYRKLNPTEQRFLAMTVTAYGESGILRDERDMKMIMKVIDNRVQYVNSLGRHGTVNELDIILQPLQFSMYNANLDDWRRSLEASPHDPGVILAVKSYRNYPKTKFEPSDKVDQIRHYHATYVNPNWASVSKRVPVLIDGERTKLKNLRYSGRRIDVRHEFYENIRWGFVKNPWSP